MIIKHHYPRRRAGVLRKFHGPLRIGGTGLEGQGGVLSWRGFAGLGQIDITEGLDTSNVDLSTIAGSASYPGADQTSTTDISLPGLNLPDVAPSQPIAMVPVPQSSATTSTSASSGGGTPINWGPILQSVINQGARAAAVAELPAGAALLPSGAVLPAGSYLTSSGVGVGTGLTSTAALSSFTSFLPLLLIGGAAILIFNMAGRR